MSETILHLHCTTCPSECALTATVEAGGDGSPARVVDVRGNRCPRGNAFARQEITCPMRVLTTTVPIVGGGATCEHLVPVRTKEAIPLAVQPTAMEELRHITVTAPIRMGDVVVADIAGTGVEVIASCDMA